MIGRTPGSIVATRPIKDGVIADFDTRVAMMEYFINKGNPGFGSKPSVIICVPGGGTTDVATISIGASFQAVRIVLQEMQWMKQSPLTLEIDTIC